MHLASLELVNFRGVDRLTIELEPDVTVVLGEHGVGKTSVVDAIEYALGASRAADECPFKRRDLRREGSPPPQIELNLTFSERAPEEWDRPALARLQPAFIGGSNGHRAVRLRLTGRAAGEGMTSEWRFLDAEGAPLFAQERLELVQELRGLCPCLFLSSDRYSGTGPPKVFAGQDESRAELVRAVSEVYRRFVETRGRLAPEELHAGLGAVQKLMEEGHGKFQAQPEIRDLRHIVDSPLNLAPLSRAPASILSAQCVGMMLFLGSLLDATGVELFSPEVTPILVMEEPEAHLHPIVAVSLWGSLEQLTVQRVVTTNSSEILAATPLSSLRRLSRRGRDPIEIHQLGRNALTSDLLRRVGYHVRLLRGFSLYARSWFLVEGETEAWLMPELARAVGFVFRTEGVVCLEVAQCGAEALIKLAQALGIEWHLLVDGDGAGLGYEHQALRLLNGEPPETRITRLEEPDVEHCLWEHGYAGVFRDAARPGDGRSRKPKRRRRRRVGNVTKVIRQATRARSKPYMALRVIEAVYKEGSPGVPAPLQVAIETAVRLARESVGLEWPGPSTPASEPEPLEG